MKYVKYTSGHRIAVQIHRIPLMRLNLPIDRGRVWKTGMDWVLYGIDWYSRFAGRWHILTCDYAASANQGDWPTIMQCPLALQMKSTRRPHLRMTSREIHYIRCLCRPSNNLSTKIMLNWVFAKHAQFLFLYQCRQPALVSKAVNRKAASIQLHSTYVPSTQSLWWRA